MLCREAKRRLIDAGSSGSSISDDRELMEHLAQCPDCAREAEAVKRLHRALERGRIDDTVAITPIEVQKVAIDARLAQSERNVTTGYRLSRLLADVFRKPHYAVGLTLAAVVVLLVFLTPFKHDRVVGYNLSVAGVSEDIATDDDRLCDLLYALGATDAGVDLIGCDTTCDLLIYDLRSTEEVHLVTMAIRNLNDADVTTNVIPVIAQSPDS